MQNLSWLRSALLFGLLIVAVMLVLGMMSHARAQSGPLPDKPFAVDDPTR